MAAEDGFRPALADVLREGYGLAALRTDAVAGLTVAIVALPLSMGIAIASGVPPERGLITAIAGGFVVSLLGGSRFQIGGPAGAFIVLVLATVQAHGLDGLILATFLSGIILLGTGALRLGVFIRYIPFPVTVGFTAGIAVIILASQLRELLGLALTGPEPGPLLPKLRVLAEALPSLSPAAAALSALTILAILGLRRWRPHWPGMLVAVALASLLAATLALPVETIGTRFGGIPATLPAPALPELSWPRVREVLPAALSFALLGAIESLLSAVVADSMSGRRHRSNAELLAQGAANMGSACFGGFCVTGTIARTATNVRAGAHGPVAGMLHALFLLGFMLLLAPLAAFVPLAALAGMLAVVAWNMAEHHHVATLLRASRGDAAVLLVTFGLVVFRDLTEGILVGFALGTLLFLHRMAHAVAVERPGDGDVPVPPGVAVVRINGAFFFGAAARVATALDRIGERPRALVLDFAAVPLIDSTAAAAVESFVRQAHSRGAEVRISGATPAIRRTLLRHGVRPPRARFRADIAAALASLRPPGVPEAALPG